MPTGNLRSGQGQTSAPILSLTVGLAASSRNYTTVNDFIVGAASVPEPASLILIGLGAAFMLAAGRFRTRICGVARSRG